MKSIFRYIIFSVLAVSAVLAACSKDTVVERNPGTSEENQGLRTIILQFSPDTKAAFDGVKSRFEDGDVIKVANATQSEDATVQVSGGIASITTSLIGPLTAVFPSTAANVSGNGPLEDPQFKVKAQQNGTSGDAVIAVARIEGKNAVFELKTALFQITPPSTATQIIIKSLSPVVDGVARTGTAAEINTEGTDKTVITVGDGSANLSNPIYVAFKPGVNLTDLSFDAGETIGMKGIPTSKLGTTPNTTVVRGKYTIDNQNWHPYVEIGGKKWATMNVGATTVAGDYKTCRGDYYQWGSVNTLYTAINWTSASAATFTWAAGKSSGYVTANREYTATVDGTLPLVNDVAYVKWGGPWRMPTGRSGDFNILVQKDGIDYTVVVENGISVHKFTQSGKTLIIPTAGRIDGASIQYTSDAYCWSSTYYTKPWCLGLSSAAPKQWSTIDGYYGMSVRPVADL